MMRLERAHHANVSSAQTNVDAGVRRHDVYASRARYPFTVFPTPGPRVATRTTVIPAQAGIHASLRARSVETLSHRRRALAPGSPERCHWRQAKRPA